MFHVSCFMFNISCLIFHVSCFMFNVSCIHTPKNATRVKSSIELAQVMKSLESIDDFSYIGIFRNFFSSKWKQIAFFLLSL